MIGNRFIALLVTALVAGRNQRGQDSLKAMAIVITRITGLPIFQEFLLSLSMPDDRVRCESLVRLARRRASVSG